MEKAGLGHSRQEIATPGYLSCFLATAVQLAEKTVDLTYVFETAQLIRPLTQPTAYLRPQLVLRPLADDDAHMRGGDNL